MLQINDNTDFFAYVDGFAELSDENIIPVFTNKVYGAVYTISITVYKRAHFLKQCLDSALHQDTSIPYQVYVIDDDPMRNNEVEVFMQSYSKNALVSYYKKHANEGLMNNMNRAIHLPKTEWVVMIHDDDWLCSNYLSAIDNYRLKFKDYSIFVPSHTTFYFDHFIDTKSSLREWFCKVKGCWRIKPLDFINGTCATPTGTLYKRDAFLKSGGYIEDYGYAADYVFFARYSSYEKIMRVNSKLFNYRFAENESLKQETIDNFRLIGHYLSVYLLNRYKFQSQYFRNRYERTRLWRDFNHNTSEIERVLGYNVISQYEQVKPLPFYNIVSTMIASSKFVRIC